MTTITKTSYCARLDAVLLGATLLLSLSIQGQTLNVLHNFRHNELGYQPNGGLIVGPNGEIYGTTSNGGALGLGLAYALLPPNSPGGAWKQVVLHSFGKNGDGPVSAGLLLGPSGALYGVTSQSANGEGTVFRLTPPKGTNKPWREIILHAFTDSNADGEGPRAAPAFGPHGELYGSTSTGGTETSGVVLE